MKNKNRSIHKGAFEAFDLNWFKKNQSKLFWLLNTPGVKTLFRSLLRVNKDVPKEATINYVGPNFIKYGAVKKDGKILLTTDVRTHAKFAKRVYFAFKPFWWGLHYLDEFLLDKHFPQQSFGFTTLTAYPDPHVEVDSVDGDLLVTSYTDWATYQGKTTCDSVGPSDTTGDGPVLSYSGGSGGWIGTHCIFGYDTSSIPAEDEISSAVLSIYHSTTFVNNGLTPAQSVIVSEGNIAVDTNLVTSDWPADGSTNFASVPLTGMANNSYIAWTLNASGISHIDKAGTTNYGASLSSDFNNSEPTQSNGTANMGQIRFADFTGTATDPKLVVIHAVPATGYKNLLLMGVG